MRWASYANRELLHQNIIAFGYGCITLNQEQQKVVLVLHQVEATPTFTKYLCGAWLVKSEHKQYGQITEWNVEKFRGEKSGNLDMFYLITYLI